MKLSNNTVLFKHPNIYIDKVAFDPADGKNQNLPFFIYTSHSGILVCDHRVVDIVNMCNGSNTFLEIANGIEAEYSEIQTTIEYLAKKGVISIDSPIVPHTKFSDALSATSPDTYGFWIHVTNNCNLKCKYCYIDKSSSVMRASKMDAILNAIISSAKLHNAKKLIIKISGGEPLTNIDSVEHLVAYVSDKCQGDNALSLHFELLTNGTIVSEPILSFIKRNNISVSISLDSAIESNNEARVFADGKGSTELVKRNIDTYIANGISPRIMVTISNNNISQLPALTEYLIKKHLRFRFSLEKDCSLPVPPVVENSSQLLDSLNTCFSIMNNALLNGDFSWQFKFNNIRFGISRERSCSAGTHFFAVGANGEFASCGMGLALNNHSVSYDGDLIGKLQNHYLTLFNTNAVCQKCNWLSCCANDCPLQSQMNASGNGTSPFCDIIQQIIPHLLRLDALRIFMRCNGKKRGI